MPTVVIVHAAEDTLPARALAEKLRQAQLTVVLEKPPGEDLRNAVKAAQVTVALWSPRSVGHAALADDVAFARGKSKLVHASMQNAAIPDQFKNDKAVNLTGWRGEDDFAPWRDLAKLVTDRAGVASLPPPAPRPPSGFFQPGRAATDGAAPAARPAQRGSGQGAARPPAQAAPRPAPPPRPAQSRPAPRPAAEPARANGGGGRGMLIGIIAVVVIAAAGGGGYWFWSQSQGAQASATAWDSVDTNDAAALRAFLAGSPGAYRDEAETALAELELRTFEAASDSDSIEALEAFLQEFPNSEHAIAARGRIAELRTLEPSGPDAIAPEAPEAPAAPADPDLVPPGSTPDASGGGPTALTPPAEPESTEPADAPPD